MDLAAAVDVGSNTLRILIARLLPGGGLEPVAVDRRVTRLSEGLTPGGPLLPAARERSLSALRDFGRLARRHLGDHLGHRVFGAATAAVRLAADGDDFLARATEESGLALRKVTGVEEARLTALGVLSGLDERIELAAVVDPGGRSTELIPVVDGLIQPGVSLDLGVVALTEQFLRHDPPRPGELDDTRREIRRRLKPALDHFPPRGGLKLIGTAGTVTTIAAMLMEMAAYDPRRVTGTRLDRHEVAMLGQRLAAMPAAARLALKGLEPGREDVILPGVMLVEELMDLYGRGEMAVCDASILEGLIIDGLAGAGRPDGPQLKAGAP